MRSARRPVAWLLATAIVAAACTAESSEPVATTTSVAPATSAPTTVPPTTSTTLAYELVPVDVENEPEISMLLSSLYTWLSDRDAPQPDLPSGMVDYLDGTLAPETEPLTGELFSDGVVNMGTAAVALVDDEDVILLVDDGGGWRIVGAWLARHDIDAWFGEPIRRVLVIGTDARDWQDAVRFRGDSLHILSSNIAEGGGGILGFPRDSWVETPYGTDKFTHVNAIYWKQSDDRLARLVRDFVTNPAFSTSAAMRQELDPPLYEELLAIADDPTSLDRMWSLEWSLSTHEIDRFRTGPYGGDVTVQVAEDLTGLPIEGYILTGFRSFQLLLNDYGGIEIDIPFSMADSSSGAFFKPGLQMLWGKDALAFSRNRHIGGGDFTRSFHQGLVILARLNALLEGDFTTLPYLISALAYLTWTNLSLEDLLTLGAGAFLLDPGNVGNQVVPGSVATRGGASVVLLSNSAEKIYRDMDDGILGNETVTLETG